jgi:hypothetical protein
VGAAVRIGDTMHGLAAVRSICDGTAAATRLNMVKEGTCGLSKVFVWFMGRFGDGRELTFNVVGVVEVVTVSKRTYA